jgi:hypothetical protein
MSSHADDNNTTRSKFHVIQSQGNHNLLYSLPTGGRQNGGLPPGGRLLHKSMVVLSFQGDPKATMWCLGRAQARARATAVDQGSWAHTPRIIKDPRGVNGCHPLKIVIPGDGPHLQKSIVDKERSGSSWIHWGRFWACMASGVAGWGLGEINRYGSTHFRYIENMIICTYGSRTSWIQTFPNRALL